MSYQRLYAYYVVKLNGSNIFRTDQNIDPDTQIFNPKLTLGVNSGGSLTFTIGPEHYMYSKINVLSSYVSVDAISMNASKTTRKTVRIFYGRVINYTINDNMMIDVTCEGGLAFLNDAVLAKPTAERKTRQAWLSWAISEFNTFVGANDNRRFAIAFRSSDLNVRFDFTEPQLIIFDDDERIDFTPTYEYKVAYDLMKEVGLDYARFTYMRYSDTAPFQTINVVPGVFTPTVGATLTSDNATFKKTVDGANTFRGVRAVGLGTNKLQISRYVTIDSSAVKTTALLEDEGIRTAADLKTAATALYGSHDPVTITAHGIDPFFITAGTSKNIIQPAMRVTLTCEKLGISGAYMCSSINIDLTNPANTDWVFENPKKYISQK